MNKFTKKKVKKVKRKKSKKTNIRSLLRVQRMRGGNTFPSGASQSTSSSSPDSHVIPLSEYGVSPLPAGESSRNYLLGGGGRSGNKKRSRGKKYIRKTRFLKNRTSRRRGSKKRVMNGGGGAPFFLPDDLTNLTDFVKGSVVGAFNGYKGIETPFQTNNPYPYQQNQHRETYNSSLTDANEMYNNADNYVLSAYQ